MRLGRESREITELHISGDVTQKKDGWWRIPIMVTFADGDMKNDALLIDPKLYAE